MRSLLIFSLNIFAAYCLRGLDFGDNAVQRYVTDDNGVAVAKTKMATQLTICAWIYPKWSRWQSTFMGIFEIRTTETLDNPNVISTVLMADENGALIIRALDVHSFKLNDSIPYNNILRMWNRFCLSYDFEKNEAQAAFNGEVSDLVRDPVTLANMGGRYDGNILTGAGDSEQLVLIVGRYSFDKNPFIGVIADLSVWDRTMSEAELAEKTNCREINTEEGNLINSSTSWNLTADLVTTLEDIPLEDLRCQKKAEKINAFLPIPELTREEAEDLCHKFGEDVRIAGEFLTRDDFDHYYDGLERNKMYKDQCGFYDNGRIKTWLPYRRNQAGTALIHEVTGESLLGEEEDKMYVEWYAGPQSNNYPDQCGSAYFGLVPRYQNLMEDDCSSKKCTACEIKNSLLHTSMITLRGLCRYSFFDKTYQIQYSPDNMISYVGLEKTIISYDFEENVWTMRDVSNPYVTAVSEASFRSLAIGNFEWSITNDTICSRGSHSTVLSLTSCASYQFTCNDGLCISLENRCDGKTDCKDFTDEIDCRVIEFDSSYNKFLSPPVVGLADQVRLPVMVTVRLHALNSFDPVNASYQTKLTVSLKWTDSRLNYNNLRAEPETNRMGPVESEKIWFPFFTFDNTNKKVENIIDAKSSLKVIRNGSGELSDAEHTENKYIFPGRENYIQYERFYSEQFECDYFLHWYPFDYQTCYIDIKPSSGVKDFIKLVPDVFEYDGPLDLTEYNVKKTQMMIENETVLRVEIVIQRRLLSLILTTFIPTIILNVIGHMSNYFKEFFFEGLMGLNVTVMLVLTTMFLSVSTNLPPTAYIKMIDCWLIFNLLKPFVDIIVQTYIETLRDNPDEEKKDNGKAEAWAPKDTSMDELKSRNEKDQQNAMSIYYGKANKNKNEKKIKLCKTFLRVIYPTFSIVFIVLFWMVGLVQYYKQA